MKNGDTLRGPRSFSSDRGLGDAVEAADAGADHHAGGASGLLRSSGCQSASSSAWRAAHIAKMMKSSTLRWSFGSIHWSGLKVPSVPSPRGITQAIWLARSETSKVSILPGAALAVEDALPGRLDAAAERRNHAEPRDDNPPHVKNSSPKLRGP